MKPFLLGANPVERFYAGGPRIARFRGGDGSWSGTAPEDWVASTTEVFGAAGLGLSVLEDGTTLRDAIASDPEAYLGGAHVERFGADLGVLVKLLDAGERLPVHWHPDRGFARTHLHGCYGKTEAWIVLEADPGARVWLGWRGPVSARDVERWYAAQDAAAMLRELNGLDVAAGDAVFVPAGTPHAIGEGILLLEVQEPTDLSVLLEWAPFAPDPAGLGDLGIGAASLASVSLGGTDTGALVRRAAAGALLPPDAAAFFRADRVRSGAELPPGCSVLVVIEGAGTLATDDGAIDVRRGDTALVPFAAGRTRLSGALEAVACRPPERSPDCEQP